MAAKPKNVEFTKAFIEVAFSEPSQTSKMELFVKILNSIKLLTVLTKSSILDI